MTQRSEEGGFGFLGDWEKDGGGQRSTGAGEGRVGPGRGGMGPRQGRLPRAPSRARQSRVAHVPRGRQGTQGLRALLGLPHVGVPQTPPQSHLKALHLTVTTRMTGAKPEDTGPPTNTHTCVHTHTRAHAHTRAGPSFTWRGAWRAQPAREGQVQCRGGG